MSVSHTVSHFLCKGLIILTNYNPRIVGAILKCFDTNIGESAMVPVEGLSSMQQVLLGYVLNPTTTIGVHSTGCLMKKSRNRQGGLETRT